jgi:creatinine amidohydrolase/Fe(II)-dependent formamide hydrolase-like protein
MTSTPVRWAELRPDDFRARRDACPIVYLPIGLCEPHGHIAALGLDLLKAEYFCEQPAQRFGGVVAPAQGYHIHECGFHAPWLAEVVGEENPFLGAIPPHGDHAGRYEISQLMDIRPDLVDLSLLDRQFEANSGGRLAVGEDAAESSAAYGHTLN